MSDSVKKEQASLDDVVSELQQLRADLNKAHEVDKIENEQFQSFFIFITMASAIIAALQLSIQWDFLTAPQLIVYVVAYLGLGIAGGWTIKKIHSYNKQLREMDNHP